MKIHTGLFLISLLLSAEFLVACGPREFTRGRYDDPATVRLLDDQFNENDMQLMSRDLVASLLDFEGIKGRDGSPVVMLGRFRNRTSEHIDMKMLTDHMRTALIRTQRFRFVDGSLRQDLAEEYDYQASEFVDQATAVRMGQQLGVEYLIVGDLGSIIQQVGNDKIVYYKITMNLVDVATNVILWSDDREVRKIYRRRSVGL
ncbi:MAG: penicillin-binding protein activator LpoB [Bradymonadales bacterium]|nr:MAG: penicillin-binding protein activator LpoB [Bradymonadales bacterium]